MMARKHLDFRIDPLSSGSRRKRKWKPKGCVIQATNLPAEASNHLLGPRGRHMQARQLELGFFLKTIEARLKLNIISGLFGRVKISEISQLHVVGLRNQEF